MLRGSEATLYRSIRQMNQNGVVGNPAAASAATGIQIARLVGAQLLEIIQDINL
jgi:creatinine amidohydrolase/Fe(II)-dependent formamide hydrolase-like protein